MKNLIVKEAKSWIGTKFHLYGRIKRNSSNSGACDCIGFILGISKNLELKSKTGQLLHLYDHFGYKLQNTQPMLENFFDAHLYETHEILPGTLALFQINQNLQHIGLIIDYDQKNLGIIHAELKNRKIVEHHLGQDLIKKLTKLYRFT